MKFVNQHKASGPTHKIIDDAIDEIGRLVNQRIEQALTEVRSACRSVVVGSSDHEMFRRLLDEIEFRINCMKRRQQITTEYETLSKFESRSTR